MPKIMRAKDVRVALKRDDCVEYLKERFGFTTNEQVYLAVRKVLPAEADSIISQMNRKHKQYKKRAVEHPTTSVPVNVLLVNQNCKPVPSFEEVANSMISTRDWLVGGKIDLHLINVDETSRKVSDVPTKPEAAENVEIMENTAGNGVDVMDFSLLVGKEIAPVKFPERMFLCSPIVGLSETKSYDELKKYEEDIVDAFNESQRKLDVCRADTSEKYHALEETKKEVEKLKAEVLRLAAQYKTVWEDYCTSAEKTKCEEAIHQIFSEQLEEIRMELLKVQHINISFYADGNIEVENAEIPNVSDVDIMQESNKLMFIPTAGELTINELKGVAKLQVMVRIFRESGREVDVIFESESVQTFWDNINA